MKEDFLHYVWKFQKFNAKALQTLEGQSIQIVSTGQHNHNAGPDFLYAEVVIDGQKWAGNVEIHINSSDWYAHQHETDPSYDAVVLHVVWEHDVAVYRKDNTQIPTLILAPLVATKIQEQYQQLFYTTQQWIPCEQQFHRVDSFVLDNWLERMYLERLEQKSTLIEAMLLSTNNNWEAVLFQLLFKNFGLKVNGTSFISIAQKTPFEVVQKCSPILKQIEALLMGQAGLLHKEKEDLYFKVLQEEYNYLKQKFALTTQGAVAPSFFRLRPPNFPTIRISQLAGLYHKKQRLFEELMVAKSVIELIDVFTCEASTYWETHYNFGTTSTKRKKKITKSFIHLLIINTVIPLKFQYAKATGKEVSEEILGIISSIPIEKNNIVSRFQQLAPQLQTALHSQGCLQLKNKYCDVKKCLQCAVGTNLLQGA